MFSVLIKLLRFEPKEKTKNSHHCQPNCLLAFSHNICFQRPNSLIAFIAIPFSVACFLCIHEKCSFFRPQLPTPIADPFHIVCCTCVYMYKDLATKYGTIIGRITRPQQWMTFFQIYSTICTRAHVNDFLFIPGALFSDFYFCTKSISISLNSISPSNPSRWIVAPEPHTHTLCIHHAYIIHIPLVAHLKKYPASLITSEKPRFKYLPLAPLSRAHACKNNKDLHSQCQPPRTTRRPRAIDNKSSSNCGVILPVCAPARDEHQLPHYISIYTHNTPRSVCVLPNHVLQHTKWMWVYVCVFVSIADNTNWLGFMLRISCFVKNMFEVVFTYTFDVF